MRSAVMLAAVMIGYILVAPCSAELITNGGFDETAGLVLGFNGTAFQAGTADYADVATLPGWTIRSSYPNPKPNRYPNLGFLMRSSGTFTPSQAGAYLVNLTHQSALSSISQSFAVEPGMAYTVSYWEKYRDLATNTLDASIVVGQGTLTLVESTGSGATTSGSGTGTLVQTTGTPSDWANFTFTFTASDSTTATLVFANTGAALTSDGTYLDTVSVTSSVVSDVPEPCMMVLFASGTAGLLACCWRRRS